MGVIAPAFPRPSSDSLLTSIPRIKQGGFNEDLFSLTLCPHAYELVEGRSLLKSSNTRLMPLARPVASDIAHWSDTTQKRIVVVAPTETSRLQRLLKSQVTVITGVHNASKAKSFLGDFNPLKLIYDGNRFPLGTEYISGSVNVRFRFGASDGVGRADYNTFEVSQFDSASRGLTIAASTLDADNDQIIKVTIFDTPYLGDTIRATTQAINSTYDRLGIDGRTNFGDGLIAQSGDHKETGVVFTAVYLRGMSQHELTYLMSNWYDETFLPSHNPAYFVSTAPAAGRLMSSLAAGGGLVGVGGIAGRSGGLAG